MIRPVTLLLLAALAAAPARAAESQIAAVAAADPDVARACAGALSAPADLLASYNACWGPLDPDVDTYPTTECPSAECEAFAARLGPACFAAFFAARSATDGALAAALAGGPAAPAAVVAAAQRLEDALAAGNPGDVPAVDLAAKLEAGDAALAAEYAHEAGYFPAFVAACAPAAAAAATASAAPGGARAAVAVAAAAALLPLLAF
jgi:hypothetical protein